MQTATYTMQGMMPAHSPEMAIVRGVKLPFGGPTGSGGEYAQGLGLGLVGGTAQPEILTITSSLEDGTFTFHYAGDRVYKTAALAYNVSLANMKTALEGIFGSGNIATVTGTAGTSYVITFAKNARIGGNIYFSETATDGAISIARTQRGSCGAGQYDVYDGSTVTTIDALNQYAVAINLMGGRVTDISTGSNQPFSPPAYQEGFFWAADIPNIASGAVGADKKLGFAIGAAVDAAGAILRLSQKN